MRRSILSLLALSLVAALAPAAQAAPDTVRRYIVVLKDSVTNPGEVASSHSRQHSARVGHVYSAALKGYSATMSETAAAKILNDSRVSYVELDGIASKSETTTQSGATWGLDRIDQTDLPLSTTYQYASTGAGVTAYVIDSGISPHSDFGTRLATTGIDYVGSDTGSDTDATDCDGHGTHVAGTIGGTTYGVAKEVRLVGVRVLGCTGSGSWSDVIAGINWVTANAAKPAVANMSLGGSASSSVDQAVANSIDSGVTYAVAAGNGDKAGNGIDACNYSPARTPSALTVGATDRTDVKARFSNYGSCLDVFAPGVGISSTTMDGPIESWSGTSMASPHVAGAAALYLETHRDALPKEVGDAVRTSATIGKVTSAGTGSPNLLLYSFLTAAPVVVEPTPTPTPTTPPPPASINLTKAVGYKVKGVMKVDLEWNGASTASVDIYRGSTRIPTLNDGLETDSIGKGSGSFIYKVCEAGTTTCSNQVTVVF